MYWWALAMIAHPGVQKRAQAELDAVVGQSRVPTFSDAPSLPYIQAMVKEILRWRPVLPLALPHIATEDDWYEGMFIPKGTICLANLWQCHLDPQYYGEDAASFNPERFLDAHGKIIPGPADTREEGHLAYGLGRRACVGKHAANESLFIYIATILWAANLETVRDEDGKEVPFDTDTFVDTGAVLYVFRFHTMLNCDFRATASQLPTSVGLHLGYLRHYQYWRKRKRCSMYEPQIDGVSEIHIKHFLLYYCVSGKYRFHSMLRRLGCWVVTNS